MFMHSILNNDQKPIPVEELTPQQLKTIEPRLYPGQWSATGFLSKGQSLSIAAQKDRETIQKTSYTFEKIADYLESLINHAVSGMRLHQGTWKLFEGKFLVLKFQTKGIQHCPFNLSEVPEKNDCGGYVGSLDYKVIRVDTGEEFTFASLHPHLIRDHHFCEEGPYRVDPETFIRFFSCREQHSNRAVSIEKTVLMEGGRAILLKEKNEVEQNEDCCQEANLNLQTLIENDLQLLKEADLTKELIADKLQFLIEKVDDLIEPWFEGFSAAYIDHKYIMRKKTFAEHFLTCSQCNKKEARIEFYATDIETGNHLGFTSMHPHGIREHGYFSKGDLRIDPKKAIPFLGLKSPQTAKSLLSKDVKLMRVFLGLKTDMGKVMTF